LTPPALRWFVDTGVVSEVVRVIKSGKESQIYLTRRFCGDKIFYFVAKVHKPRMQRSFKSDKVYRTGWVFVEGRRAGGRVHRAVLKTSRYGRGVIGARWVEEEFQALKILWRNGADVPIPILKHENTILMTYIGDPDEPAPKLCEIFLNQDEIVEVFRQVVKNLKIIFSSNLIHGDLSPFNILYWKGKIWIIDFPQVVNLHQNPHAMDLLFRDIRNICKYFYKQGINCSTEEVFRQVTGLTYTSGKTYQDLLSLSIKAPDRRRIVESRIG